MKAHLKNSQKLLIVIFAVMTLMTLRLDAQELFFEETYHAVDIDDGVFKIGEQTAMDEARAWQFAAQAPGTINGLIINNNGEAYFSAAYTILHEKTGWVAKMLREECEPPKYHIVDDQGQDHFIEGRTIKGAYSNLNKGRGYPKYGKCFAPKNDLGVEQIMQQPLSIFDTVSPIDLKLSRKGLLVKKNDNEVFSGYIIGQRGEYDSYTINGVPCFSMNKKNLDYFEKLGCYSTITGLVAGLDLDLYSIINSRFVYINGYVVNGKEQGEWQYRYVNENVDCLLIVATYKNGKLNGTAKYYKPDGCLYQEVEFKDGKLDGYFIWYNEAGEIIYRYTYSNGERIKAEQFAEDPRDFCD